MFVYLKEPMAYTSIGGKRVCGKLYAYGTYGPSNISIEDYKSNRDKIIDADYPAAWLKQKFGRDVQPFNFEQLRAMSVDDLIKFTKVTLGIKYFRGEDTDTKTKNALLKALMHHLT